MAPSYQECVEIEQAFRAKNLPLFVAYYRRSLPRFLQVRDWLQTGAIGALRHVEWRFVRPPHAADLSGQTNWRTDASIAPGGHFDDLASHGLDLLTFLLGPVQSVAGVSTNQQQLYSAKDAVAACWLHESGVTGSASWNFGCAAREDSVTVFGSLGKIEFSVFDNLPLVLDAGGQRQELMIAHPENIQLHHVENMRRHLSGEALHPSSGVTAAHTAWMMDRILGKL
jgi:predicted dehydrogenase